MKLLIDLGNSRVKWAVERADTLEGPFGFARVAATAAADFSQAWRALQPDAVLLCSVAGPAQTAALRSWVRQHWALEPIELPARARTGAVVNAYRDPVALGADRWANLLGARALLGATDAVIVDAGTAVTVDGLRADGRHVGGAIFAGLAATRMALAQAAPALAEPCRLAVDGEPPATDTFTAVGAGTAAAFAGAVDRVAARVGAGLDDPALLLTGGDGAWLCQELNGRWRHEPLLTLRGLLAAQEAPCAG